MVTEEAVVSKMETTESKVKSDFFEGRYVSATDIGTTERHYDKIKAMAED